MLVISEHTLVYVFLGAGFSSYRNDQLTTIYPFISSEVGFKVHLNAERLLLSLEIKGFRHFYDSLLPFQT